MKTGYCFKFDLTAGSLRSLQSLYEFYNDEGAVRASVLITSFGAWSPQTEFVAESIQDKNWIAVKIPSLEGTEFWILPESKQKSMDQRMGFAKPSEVILRLSSDEIQKCSFKDPVHRNEVRIRWRNVPQSVSTPGVSVQAVIDPWKDEEIELAKDFGCLAFTESTEEKES